MMENPPHDEAESCPVHPRCIQAFIKSGPDDGRWHFALNEDCSRWDVTNPNGEKRVLDIRLGTNPLDALKLYKPALHRVLTIIDERALLPPCS